MRRTVLLGAIVLALAAMGPVVAQSPQPDLVGTYQCDGKNPDGSAYHGVVEIARLRETFRVRWTMDDGAILGVGIYSGGVFAVSYFGGAPAVVVYKVDGGRLVGEWTMGGVEGAVYAETLTKTSSEVRPQEPRRQEPWHQGPDRPEPGRQPGREDPARPTQQPPGGIQL